MRIDEAAQHVPAGERAGVIGVGFDEDIAVDTPPNGRA